MTAVMQSIRRHPWRTTAVAFLAVVGVGAFANRGLIDAALLADDDVDQTLPLVEPLQAAPGETVYRIDPEHSSATVAVTEQLAGHDTDVELVTHGLAGDIGVSQDGRTVRLGAVAVNVEQLTSDNSLRDKMIRHEYLESHDHPEVRLTDATVTLPDGATAAHVDGATITGTLHVKGTDHPTTWKVDAKVAGDTLTATATADLKMSDLGVGPISKAGLVNTSDDMKVTLRLSAVDGTSYSPPAVLTSAAAGRAADTTTDGSPSYSKDVQPILEQNCATCHKRGAIGASMWTLGDAQDVADVADGLAVVTRSGYMPPWPASKKGVAMQHARGLTEKQISTIVDWASAGAPLDVPGTTKVQVPKAPEVPVPRADERLALPEPYQGSPARKDDYRCFILDPKVTSPTFMTGYTFEPDLLQIVHHALVYQQPAAERASAEARDAADPGSGWSCTTGMGGGADGALVGGWVPGARPHDFEDGVGFLFQPGDFLVVQIHYHYEANAPADQSRMTLELSHDAGITALKTTTLIGPVELPCPVGVSTGLCDRKAAVADVAARFGPGAAMVSDMLNRVCRTTPEALAATSDGVTSTTTCDYRMRTDGEIVDVLGHMHEIGSSYRMTLNPDTPKQTVLLDIPKWNFDWQLNYQPVEPVRVAKGDTIRVSCSWDRRLRFDPNPRYIVFAEGTQDEMCFSTVTIKPDA